MPKGSAGETPEGSGQGLAVTVQLLTEGPVKPLWPWVLPLLGSVDPQEGTCPASPTIPMPVVFQDLNLVESYTSRQDPHGADGGRPGARICWASAGRPPAQEALHCHHPGWPPGLLATRLRVPACVFPLSRTLGASAVSRSGGCEACSRFKDEKQRLQQACSGWPESRLIQ